MVMSLAILPLFFQHAKLDQIARGVFEVESVFSAAKFYPVLPEVKLKAVEIIFWQADGKTAQSNRSIRWWGSTDPGPGIHADMMVIISGSQECRAGTIALLEIES